MNTSAETGVLRLPSGWSGAQVSFLPTMVAGAPTRLTSFKERPTASAAAQSLRAVAQYALLGASQLEALPPIKWAVKGLFPQMGLGLVYGASGVGKSFLLLDLACAIAEGRPWFGRRTARSPVVYLCLEGAIGFVGRVKAWQAAEGRSFPELVRIIIQPFNLLDLGHVRSLLKDIKEWTKTLPADSGPPVIVIDTLNRSIPGADESGSTDMSLILEACAVLSEGTQGLTIVLHHVGKDADRGPRGHSSLGPAVDASLLVVRSGKGRFWEAKKVKDGQDGIRGAFELQTVVLGMDDDGDEVSSCTVRAGECSVSDAKARELSASIKAALVSLLEVMDHCTALVNDEGDQGFALEDWRAALYRNCSAASASGKRNAFHRALTELQELGYATVMSDRIVVSSSAAELIRSLPDLQGK
jgi:hypothetical protein